MIPICQHCGHSKVNRPRGLCWSCYYKPGVKDMYPSTSKYARRGVGNFTGNAPISGEPTIHPPGTPEKMAVLEMRAKNKQALWHPLDAQYPNDPRPLLALRGLATEDASEERPVLRNRLAMAANMANGVT